MLSCAELLLAALAIVAPSDGAKVELLSGPRRAYLEASREVRFARLGDSAARARLVEGPAAQLPVRLAWSGAKSPVVTLAIDEGERVQEFVLTNRTEVEITNLDLGRTYRWRVTSEGETAAASFVSDSHPPRLIAAEGVYNMRDLGGWTGLDGRRVKTGKIYRSAGFRSSAQKKGGSMFAPSYAPGAQRITAAGIATVRDEFGIKTDLELRNDQESACFGDSILGPDVRWVRVPFGAYEYVGNLDRGREPFGEIFREFLDENNYPIVFHCSGGRDRSGSLAFLLNGLLGVSEDDLCRDWEATAFEDSSLTFRSDRILRLTDYIASRHGETFSDRLVNYAHSCGITDDEIARFRAIMLEPEAK